MGHNIKTELKHILQHHIVRIQLKSEGMRSSINYWAGLVQDFKNLRKELLIFILYTLCDNHQLLLNYYLLFGQ